MGNMSQIKVSKGFEVMNKEKLSNKMLVSN